MKAGTIILLCLLSIAIICISVYSIAIFQGLPEWVLQYTFYAFMTALLTFIFTILVIQVGDIRKVNKLKQIEKRNSLESLKKEYARCVQNIENNIEENIRKNKIANTQAGLYDQWVTGDEKISEEFKKQVQEFNRKCEDYITNLKLSEQSIRNTIEKEIKRIFPKTREKSDELNIILESDFFMKIWFVGDMVNTNWLRITHPRILQNISKEIDETERDNIDLFFKHIRDELEKDRVLLRFRKEIGELVIFGKKIVGALQKEIDSINKQLENYRYLGATEDLKFKMVNP